MLSHSIPENDTTLISKNSIERCIQLASRLQVIIHITRNTFERQALNKQQCANQRLTLTIRILQFCFIQSMPPNRTSKAHPLHDCFTTYANAQTNGATSPLSRRSSEPLLQISHHSILKGSQVDLSCHDFFNIVFKLLGHSCPTTIF